LEVVKVLKMRKPDLTVEDACKVGYVLATLSLVRGVIKRLKALKAYLKIYRKFLRIRSVAKVFKLLREIRRTRTLIDVWFDEFAIYLIALLNEVKKLEINGLINEEFVKHMLEELKEFKFF